MGYIHCCGRLVKSRVFVLPNYQGFVDSRLLVVESCPHCQSYIVVLLRTNINNRIEAIRRSNVKARKLFEKLECDFLFEEKIKPVSVGYKGNSYLGYSYFGVKKKCYSNLSTLKCGLFDPYSNLEMVQNTNDKGLIAL